MHVVADHIDLVEAASMPTVYSLAWHALFETGRLAIGETLLIHAAASGVTTAAVQLAKRAGAQVIVTARTDDELDHARAHGADKFINTTEVDVPERGQGPHQRAWRRHGVRPPRPALFTEFDPRAAAQGPAGLLRHHDGITRWRSCPRSTGPA